MNKERLEDLLFGFRHSTISAEELEELLEFVRLNQYQDIIYEVMEKDWDANKVGGLLSDQQVDKFYQKIISDKRFNHQERPYKLKLFSSRMVAAAAIAAVLFVVLGVYLFSGFAKQDDRESIMAGIAKATLTLANGNKITLDQNKQGILADQTGVQITTSANGQLIYTLSDVKQSSQSEISYNTLETPNGGQYQLILQDGTKVWLNASSSIKYPASFASLKQRKVILDGEAYFEVAHNKSVPFFVSSGKQEIEVLGTHFNVNAYHDESAMETTLLEGLIKLSNQSSNAVILKPGEQGIVSDGIHVENVDTETAVAWKNGDFILKDEDFKTTMRKISRWYNVEIVYDVSAPEDLQLGGWVSRSKNIAAVLKIMESTGKVHFKVEGRRVTVTK